MFELYLRLINLLQCTGQIVRENIHDDTKYLIIFKGISFTDSSLNDLIDFEEEQKKANKIKNLESYYLQEENILFVTLTL